MNLFELITKLFLGSSVGSTLSRPEEMSRKAIDQIKLVFRSLLLLATLGAFQCILLGYLIDRILQQLDAGQFYPSNSITFLLSVVVLNLGAIIWAWKNSRSSSVTMKTSVSNNTPATSPLEMALAALILNYVKEREQLSKNAYRKTPEE